MRKITKNYEKIDGQFFMVESIEEKDFAGNWVKMNEIKTPLGNIGKTDLITIIENEKISIQEKATADIEEKDRQIMVLNKK